MSEKMDIIRHLKLGQSIRLINKETGIHRTVIRALQRIALENHWLKKERPLPGEKDITSVLSARDENKKRVHTLNAYRENIEC